MYKTLFFLVAIVVAVSADNCSTAVHTAFEDIKAAGDSAGHAAEHCAEFWKKTTCKSDLDNMLSKLKNAASVIENAVPICRNTTGPCAADVIKTSELTAATLKSAEATYEACKSFSITKCPEAAIATGKDIASLIPDVEAADRDCKKL
eukprot:NODE_9923_length_618_cov_135.759596_g9654_i0.p2 GENE.NODE_9923_length_618_cov_135.759596_g9654_i0~~NODE_9923_length_618_cov_135.759596_g9654_i0.p2  ORF type:complete len:167 (+),score=66.84 NODE_9923_length_618_cov_135.759596_g9654_i0:58-501(+)